MYRIYMLIIISVSTIKLKHLNVKYFLILQWNLPGLIGLLQQRRRLLGEQDEKLILFAPIQISSWLKFYDSFIENISDSYELIPNDELVIVQDQTFDIILIAFL